MNPNSFFAAHENELRKLRKVTTEFEEQNAILSKHIENMKKGIEKLESEAEEQQKENTALLDHLGKLRQLLVQNFVDIAVPGEEDKVSVDNVDKFIEKLHNCLQQSPKEHATLTAKVKSIICRMDYPK